MAIILEGVTTCAICEQALDKPYLATSGVVFEPEHSLYRYCDAPLHIHCLTEWPYRVEFSRGYFNAIKESYNKGIGTLLVEQSDWILVTGPSGPHIKPHMKTDFAEIMLRSAGLDQDTEDPFYAAVVTGNWPLNLRSNWNQWDNFIAGGFEDALIGEALAEATKAIRDVRVYAPDLLTLWALLHRQKLQNSSISNPT